MISPGNGWHDLESVLVPVGDSTTWQCHGWYPSPTDTQADDHYDHHYASDSRAESMMIMMILLVVTSHMPRR
jgi:hypothetical protein